MIVSVRQYCSVMICFRDIVFEAAARYYLNRHTRFLRSSECLLHTRCVSLWVLLTIIFLNSFKKKIILSNDDSVLVIGCKNLPIYI